MQVSERSQLKAWLLHMYTFTLLCLSVKAGVCTWGYSTGLMIDRPRPQIVSPSSAGVNGRKKKEVRRGRGGVGLIFRFISFSWPLQTIEQHGSLWGICSPTAVGSFEADTKVCQESDDISR